VNHHVAVRAQVDAVVSLIERVLGEDLLAAYLHGSAVLGGLQPRSDLDIMAVSRRETTADERGRLVETIRPLSRKAERPDDFRPVELTIVTAPDLRSQHPEVRVDFQYGEWLQDEFDRGVNEPSPDAQADLPVLLAMVRLNGRAIRGPSPTALLPEVTPSELARSMRAGVDGLMGDLEWDMTNVVLTLARIWSTLADGRFRTKDAAANWAAERIGPLHAMVLVRARDIYLGAEERWDGLGSAARAAANDMRRRIERGVETSCP
jgi:predicted nucleotidyltransferase